MLRKSHKALHPLLLSTEEAYQSDGNIVSALVLQTPICAASKFLISHDASISPSDDRTLRRLGALLAGAARQSMQDGIFPSISVGSNGEMTTTGGQLSNVMGNAPFIKMVERCKLENGGVAVDWWCGFNISGKRFAILQQLGLAPAVTLVYVSDRKTAENIAQAGLSLTPHLPLHDSSPIGM
jgi:hypothetical protein